MVSLEQVEAMIKTQLPDAEVWVKDLGGGDHLEAVVVSEAFSGKTRVSQHQLVYSALKEPLASEAIHALALRTFTPTDWTAAGQPV